MKTAIPSLPGIARDWHVIDADGAVLGRVASQAAMILMGKHKPRYTPFIDTGDHVIVVNAAKIRLTGDKENQKMYRRHSGYPGGLTETLARTVRQTRPTRMVEEAIQDRSGRGDIGKQLSPVLQGSVAGHDRGSVFIAPHHDFQQVFPRLLGQGLEPHVVDDHQVERLGRERA